MSEAFIDARLSVVQSLSLIKGEHIVACSSQILGLVSELEIAEHVISEVDRDQALLRGLPKNYDVTVESIMSLTHTFSEAFSKLIVRETRFHNYDDAPSMVLVFTTPRSKQARNCFSCRKPKHFARDYRKKSDKRMKSEMKSQRSASIVEK